jgi:H+/Cl- antiporter ClcA
VAAAKHDRRAGLSDFGFRAGDVRLVALAVPIGAASAFIALALLDGIGLLTNALSAGRLSTSLSAPGDGPGLLAVLIPVAGGVVIGLMARYGSEQIRGHGIPEAMENILAKGSRVAPRLALLKPVSSVVSIGTGGPFGAEGPIILTGGAFGSVLAQFLRLTAAERKTLLVAGAAAGMSGVFGTPVAATLLAVELLLFEWRPRSMIPAATAAVVAAAVRERLADAGLLAPVPLFPVPSHPPVGEAALAGALLVGIAGGALAWVLTAAVYGAEDGFGKLRIHWWWWPAIGGLVVGLGGLVDSRALGVGYDSLADELAGRMALGALAALLIVKLVIWSIALGSGTSGGILAPLLLMGAAVGGLLSPVLAGGSVAIWCLLGMAAAMAGVMRSPFTAVIFAVELTHDTNALLPLLIAATVAYMMSVLVLRRSILTEKVARKGVHVSREYSADPLEALRVRDVMVAGAAGPPPLDGLVAYPDETLRQVADRMVEHRVEALPVVDDEAVVRGRISQQNLFRARVRMLDEERRRERHLRLPRPFRPAPERSTLQILRSTMGKRGEMSETLGLTTAVVGYQAREAGGGTVVGEVQGVRPRGVRIHKIPGHPRHHGYLPAEAIARIERSTNTLFLTPGIGVAQVLDAPPPPDERPDGWHASDDWWADLLGHYGLYDSEGKGSEPFLHADQK